MRPALTSFLCGILFSLGLGISGMTQPTNVLAFLDVTGAWDPRLALVMAGAIGVHAALRPLILRRRQPVLAPAFPSFPRARLDARLLAGAALFGVGWGLGGFCPGPALTSLATGAVPVLVFVSAMLAGMFLFAAGEARLRARAGRPETPSPSPSGRPGAPEPSPDH